MHDSWRRLRHRVLTPDLAQSRLDRRGFHVKDPAARELLETIGTTFITGFGYAVRAPAPVAAEKQLESVQPAFRGFAYEGAAMGLAIMDGLALARGGITRLLDGGGAPHRYMVYIGVGWALARLPRWRWRAIFPTDPLLRWLALDGYGFHQAYFHTDRYVHGQHRDAALPGSLRHLQPYAAHAIDQGIGRALWFVEGADVDRLADTIDRFPTDRHGDLYSGAGLAATYAGGADAAELIRFRNRSGAHRPVVAQGSAFAAKARVNAGLVTAHTHVATGVLCGSSPERAAAVTDDTRTDLPADDATPAFAVWRQRIADRYASVERS